jgi:hypothetical protein
MKKFKQIFLGMGALLTVAVFGDSPLTSTAFSEAYLSEPIVMAAARARGKITKQIMEYLADQAKPIGVKVAVINKLSWDINGKNNANLFLDYLRENSNDSISRVALLVSDSLRFVNSDSAGFSFKDPFIETLEADELLCYAYLKALDNYFNVESALEYAEMAVQKRPDSYTFCIITALIQAQNISQGGIENCDIYNVCKYVKEDLSLKQDLKEEAVKIIFDYMDLYKCK